MNDITLIEKIQHEQAEIIADLQMFLESEKNTTAADLDAIQKKQAEIDEVIQKMAENQ